MKHTRSFGTIKKTLDEMIDYINLVRDTKDVEWITVERSWDDGSYFIQGSEVIKCADSKMP